MTLCIMAVTQVATPKELQLSPQGTGDRKIHVLAPELTSLNMNIAKMDQVCFFTNLLPYAVFCFVFFCFFIDLHKAHTSPVYESCGPQG